MTKQVLIIGGGVAGLAAGCYARMNGYDATVFEMHHLPGGLCMAWERKGYTFDGCIHYLFGSRPGQPFHAMWEELGAVQGREFVNHESLLTVVGTDGKRLTVYCDPIRLSAEMKALSPADKELIDDLCDGVIQFTKFDMWKLYEQPKALMDAEDWRKYGDAMMPFVLPMSQWALVSAADFGARFRDPFLREAVPQMFGWEGIPMMAGMQLLAYMARCNAGFPVGASLSFAQAIADRFVALGGVIEYKAQVEKILVENGRAVGVRLYDDRVFRGHAVIAAADGRNTLFNLLGPDNVDRTMRKMYSGKLPVRSQVQVSLGVKHDFGHEAHWGVHLLDEPMTIAGQEQDILGISHYCFDPGLAPAGCSSLVVMLESPYDYWQRIYGRRLYDTEQNQVAEQVIGLIEARYPQVKGAVEVVDVATPMTYERYTGNWQGATCGWLLTKETMGLLVQGMAKTIPGLAGLYLAGQWVEPGGSVPIVAASGRMAVQLLCADDRREFVTEKP